MTIFMQSDRGRGRKDDDLRVVEVDSDSDRKNVLLYGAVDVSKCFKDGDPDLSTAEAKAEALAALRKSKAFLKLIEG